MIIVFKTFRNIPKDSESFADHSVDFINLNRISGQKCHFIDQIYLKLHYWYETMYNNYITDLTIAEAFGIFQKVSEW